MLHSASAAAAAASSESSSSTENLIPALHSLALSPTPAFPCRFTGKELTIDFFKELLKSLAYREAEQKPEAPLIFSGTPRFVIFLDIDGVCWAEHTATTPHEQFMQLSQNSELQALLLPYRDMLKNLYDIAEDNLEFFKIACWNHQHMQRIAQLCRMCQARIVVTSNWRHGRTVNHLKNLFDLWGLSGYVYDKTEDGAYFRAQQIADWLAKNKDVSKFVILDDGHVEDLNRKFPNNFLHCDTRRGFDMEAFDCAKRILLYGRGPCLENNSSQQVKRRTYSK